MIKDRQIDGLSPLTIMYCILTPDDGSLDCCDFSGNLANSHLFIAETWPRLDSLHPIKPASHPFCLARSPTRCPISRIFLPFFSVFRPFFLVFSPFFLHFLSLCQVYLVRVSYWSNTVISCALWVILGILLVTPGKLMIDLSLTFPWNSVDTVLMTRPQAPEPLAGHVGRLDWAGGQGGEGGWSGRLGPEGPRRRRLGTGGWSWRAGPRG